MCCPVRRPFHKMSWEYPVSSLFTFYIYFTVSYLWTFWMSIMCSSMLIQNVLLSYFIFKNVYLFSSLYINIMFTFISTIYCMQYKMVRIHYFLWECFLRNLTLDFIMVSSKRSQGLKLPAPRLKMICWSVASYPFGGVGVPLAGGEAGEGEAE